MCCLLCDYDEGVVGYVEEGGGEDGLATINQSIVYLPKQPLRIF